MELLGTPLELYAVAAVGALVLLAYLRTNDQGTIRFLSAINAKWPKTSAADLLEAFLFIAVGALVGTWVLQPTNVQQALAGGLGWTALLTKNLTRPEENK